MACCFTDFPVARATLEILIPDFVKQTSEEKLVEGDELEVSACQSLESRLIQCHASVFGLITCLFYNIELYQRVGKLDEY